MWGLSDALEVIRPLQFKALQFGYHLALGGGVLNKGMSTNDLDIIAVPVGGQVERRAKFLAAAEKALGQRKDIAGASGHDVDNENLTAENICRFEDDHGRIVDLLFHAR